MEYKLYADGVNDDYPAIQQMLDSGLCEVYLPATKNCYRISKTLKIHSGQTLKMSPTPVLMLLPNSNCAMLENQLDVSIQQLALEGDVEITLQSAIVCK